MEVKFKPGDSHEALWEHVSSIIDDNFLDPADNITREGHIPNLEELSPILQNCTVVLWLHKILLLLPSIVKERFSTTLRSQTIMSIREEISEALLSSLLTQIENDYSSVSRSYVRRPKPRSRPTSFSKSCCLCEAAHRIVTQPYSLSKCPWLP